MAGQNVAEVCLDRQRGIERCGCILCEVGHFATPHFAQVALPQLQKISAGEHRTSRENQTAWSSVADGTQCERALAASGFSDETADLSRSERKIDGIDNLCRQATVVAIGDRKPFNCQAAALRGRQTDIGACLVGAVPGRFASSLQGFLR